MRVNIFLYIIVIVYNRRPSGAVKLLYVKIQPLLTRSKSAEHDASR